MQPADRRPRFDAQLIAQRPVQVAVDRQRGGLAAAPIGGQHGQLVPALTQRLLPHDGRGECARLAGVTFLGMVEQQPGKFLLGGDPQIEQPGSVGIHEVTGHPGERLRSAPVAECAAVQLAGPAHVTAPSGSSGRLHVVGERIGIGDSASADQVARLPTLDGRRSAEPAQPGDGGVHDRHRHAVLVAPHEVQEYFGWDGSSRVARSGRRAGRAVAGPGR